ncbi:hypothetical protein U1Q18_051369, partial [Sarracenia purpurea var. burkii]
VIVALAIMMTSLSLAHPHSSTDEWDAEFGIKGSSDGDKEQVHIQQDQGSFQQGDTVIQIQRGQDEVQTQKGIHFVQIQKSNDAVQVQQGGHVIQIQQGDGKKCQQGSVLIVSQSHNGKEQVQIQQGVNLQQGSSGQDDQPCEFQQGYTNQKINRGSFK